MTDKLILEGKIINYVEKGLIELMDPSPRGAFQYLDKAKHNLDAMRVMEGEEGFDDWTIIIGYYSMYVAATAILSQLGFRSHLHAATIDLLEYYCHHQEYLTDTKIRDYRIRNVDRIVNMLKRTKKLELNYIEAIRALESVSRDQISLLKEAKKARETSQYGLPSKAELLEYKKIVEGAPDFVLRMEQLLKELRGEA